MGNFYFDETIQGKAGFIIGAFVFSDSDLSPIVFSALEKSGLTPGVDEFKSGAYMASNPQQAWLRDHLSALLTRVRVGVVVIPADDRSKLGAEALRGLEKILKANSLEKQHHKVFFDEDISISSATQDPFRNGVGACCELFLSQDSKTVGGIQLADLVAHSLGVMLLEQLGLISKKVRAGENSGYDPDLEIELGFELWASLRYSFFKESQPKPGRIPDDPVGEMMFDVENYGLHISSSCPKELQKAALQRFGECYLGCIH
jgi:hypothetical protein